jgi:ribosome recycling factor
LRKDKHEQQLPGHKKIFIRILKDGKQLDKNEIKKELEKNKEITADDCKHSQDRVQKATDDFISKVDQVIKAKEAEVMEV